MNMGKDVCRVSYDLMQFHANEWECTCDEIISGEKCNGCYYNEIDYFDEPDSYNET